jgi:hypothetical protein
VSGKRYEVLTDPGEVHDFLGPRMHYMHIGLIIGEPFKESVVIGLDWYHLLTHLKIGKHDDPDQVDDDYFLVRNYRKGDIDVGDDYRRAVLKLLRIWPCFGEPLARKMLNRVANELARLWWPKAGRPALVPPKTLRYFRERVRDHQSARRYRPTTHDGTEGSERTLRLPFRRDDAQSYAAQPPSSS